MNDQAFTDVQMAQLRLAIKEGVEEAFADAGLRIDEGDNQDAARRDFMFLRTLRTGVNGTAAKIGWLVIAAIFAGFVWLMQAGFAFWAKS